MSESATAQHAPAEQAGEQRREEEGPASQPWSSEPVTAEAHDEEIAETEPPPQPVSEPEPVLAQEATAEPVAAEPPPQPAPAPREPRPIPTPANLTARGIELFDQGRYQESIDQFTKAIALDPKYREAWQRRAEAYGRVGRPERQKADQSRLEAI